jgi:hypothetical protein
MKKMEGGGDYSYCGYGYIHVEDDRKKPPIKIGILYCEILLQILMYYSCH